MTLKIKCKNRGVVSLVSLTQMTQLDTASKSFINEGFKPQNLVSVCHLIIHISEKQYSLKIKCKNRGVVSLVSLTQMTQLDTASKSFINEGFKPQNLVSLYHLFPYKCEKTIFKDKMYKGVGVNDA